ncbi:MAG: FAD-dependent oxidoreductase [Bacteroidota bacterium]
MNRRQFIATSALAVAAVPFTTGFREDATDVLIVGGGTGGVAAALAAARRGARVIMTEETDWIGGQLTSQAVPPDENPWIETMGGTASYQAFRHGVRDYYRQHYPLTGAAYRADTLNPGACGVSAICHEPHAALAVLEGMLAPYVSSGQVRIWRETIPIAATTDGDRVTSVTLQHRPTGETMEVTAPFVLDATELGDLLPMTDTAFVVGAEAQAETGELHALPVADPTNVQALTWCFALSYHPGETHTIARPTDYAFWRDFVPEMTPPWPGKLLSLTYSNPATLEPRTLDFDPRPGAQTERFNLWAYRRLVAPGLFDNGRPGVSLINWPQNDYLLGDLISASPEQRTAYERQAQQLSLSLCYWLQTEAPRPDGKQGWPGLQLRGDLLGTRHGLAKAPYVRESRRIRARFTVTEAHVGLAMRVAETGLPEGEVAATVFEDSVGIGSYRIDLHPSTRGDNYIDFPSLPFQIPLGALVPQRMRNLLPACKNLGVTHITNGCYRLHPVEWNIGEAAGALAAFCIAQQTEPHAVYERDAMRSDFQQQLRRDGVRTAWAHPAVRPR